MNLLQQGRDVGKTGVVQSKEVGHHWAIKKKEVRREFARFKISDCVLVDLSAERFDLGEVLNVSLGGLSFRFVDEGKSMPTSGNLRTFASTQGLIFSKIPFETIWSQTKVYPLATGHIATTYSGIRFSSLTADHHRALRCFIENHTTADLEG